MAGERRRYRTIDLCDGETMRVMVVEFRGHEGYVARWTDSCTGCFESEDGHPVGDYAIDAKHNCYIGAGCHECGYTGKRREAVWIPFDPRAYDEINRQVQEEQESA